MKVERFEDLDVWKIARRLTNAVYSLTQATTFARDRSLVDQMRRASVSILSNIAEGFERGSNAELTQFLYFAKGSSGELRAQLLVALDQGFIAQEEFNSTAELALSVSRQLGGLIKYLKQSKLQRKSMKVNP
jgi:four helix bundle protein